MPVNLNDNSVDNGKVNLSMVSDNTVDSIYSDREKDIEKSIDDIINKHKALTLKANEISEQNGINYDSVLSVESIMPGLLTRNLPYGGFTHEFSKTNLAISLEAIHAGKVGLIVGAIALICGLIYKIIQKVVSFFSGNSTNIEKTKKSIEDKTEKLKVVEDKIEPKLEPVKQQIAQSDRKIEIMKWISENESVSNLIGRVSHLYTLTTGEDISKLGLYDQLLRFVSYKEDNKTNKQASKLTKQLPNILFSDLVEHDVNTYIDFYMFIKNNVDNLDVDVNLFKQNVFFAINGKPLNNIQPHVDLLNCLGRVLNTRYQKADDALQQLTKQIQHDWLTKFTGTVTPKHITNMINLVIGQGTNPSKITDFITQLNDNKLNKDLDILIKRVEGELTNYDSPFQREKKLMEKSLVLTPEEKNNRLVMTDAQLTKFKDHLNIVKAVAVSLGVFGPEFIKSLVSINSILNAYLAYRENFNDLLDMYLDKFKE